MTLEFQNQINIQPTEEGGGGGGQPTQGGGVIVSTVVMPNAKITLPSLIVSTEIQE